MRDPKRIPIVLARLRAFWEANPDLRLGQIVSNAASGQDVFYIEDEELVKALSETPLPSAESKL